MEQNTKHKIVIHFIIVDALQNISQSNICYGNLFMVLKIDAIFIVVPSIENDVNHQLSLLFDGVLCLLMSSLVNSTHSVCINCQMASLSCLHILKCVGALVC